MLNTNGANFEFYFGVIDVICFLLDQHVFCDGIEWDYDA